MNNEKVYIEGYVVGFIADSTGNREKQIQVSSGEIVSVDEGFIHKSIAPEKVKIPQFVADWIKVAKPVYSLSGAMVYGSPGVNKWLESWDNQETFARAWLNGYEVEKEKRYTVVMKTTKQPLYYNVLDKKLFFSMGGLATKFTRKELEEAGFGWVFDCPGIEIEEVEG